MFKNRSLKFNLMQSEFSRCLIRQTISRNLLIIVSEKFESNSTNKYTVCQMASNLVRIHKIHQNSAYDILPHSWFGLFNFLHNI